MGVGTWLRGLLTGSGDSPEPVPSRRERREAGRRRHRDLGEPAWPPEERHVNPDEGRPVSDVTAGLPGGGGPARRWLGRRPR